jgi:hydrogenase expression/formation protein HypC
MCLGIPGKVVKVEGARGEVLFGTVRRTVDVRLVEDVKVGEYVLVHAGFAISKIDPEEARKTLELIAEIQIANGETE